MNILASISLSGMRAAHNAMSAAAANIAHPDAMGAGRRQTQAGSGTSDGAMRIAERDAGPASDIVGDIVGLLQARNALRANLAVFKAADAAAGALLDLYG